MDNNKIKRHLNKQNKMLYEKTKDLCDSRVKHKDLAMISFVSALLKKHFYSDIKYTMQSLELTEEDIIITCE